MRFWIHSFCHVLKGCFTKTTEKWYLQKSAVSRLRVKGGNSGVLPLTVLHTYFWEFLFQGANYREDNI